MTMSFSDGMVHKVGFVVSKLRKHGDLTTVVQQTAAIEEWFIKIWTIPF